MNGFAKPNRQGLVTLPSPRSLSSDPMRLRLRNKCNGSLCGRTRSPSQTTTPPANADSNEDEDCAYLPNRLPPLAIDYPVQKPPSSLCARAHFNHLEWWFRNFSLIMTVFSLDIRQVKQLRGLGGQPSWLMLIKGKMTIHHLMVRTRSLCVW